MKRIDSPNDDTVALEMSREEFHALRDALSLAPTQPGRQYA
jgi:hypothetical protein